MKTIEVELDQQTMERAQRFAAARSCSLHDLIKDLLEQAHELQRGTRVELPGGGIDDGVQ